jgi:hypothetical protein
MSIFEHRELKLAFLNFVVWLYVELRFSFRDPILGMTMDQVRIG